MNQSDFPSSSRRRWLLRTARYAALSGIGLLTWYLVSRSSRVCFRFTPVCQECQLLAHCRLPRSQDARSQAKVQRVK